MSIEIIKFNIVVRTQGASFSLSLKDVDSLLQEALNTKPNPLCDLINAIDKATAIELLERSCSWSPEGRAYTDKKDLMKADILEQLGESLYREVLLTELHLVKSAKQLDNLVFNFQFHLAAVWLHWDEQEQRKPKTARELLIAIAEGEEPELTERQAINFSDIAARKLNSKDTTLAWTEVLHYCSVWLKTNSK